MKIYLAGPLFNAAEREFNKRLADLLRKEGHEVWLPQEYEQREQAASVVFSKDVEGIDWAEVVVANMDGPDPDSGTCWECGYAYRKKPVIVFRTDFRAGDEPGKAPYNLMLTESATDSVHHALASTTTIAQELSRTLKRLPALTVSGPAGPPKPAPPPPTPHSDPFPAGVTTLRDDASFDRVWKIVEECGEAERHFNQLQGVYRGIASTWLLATLAGVGYLLFDEHAQGNRSGIAAGVCLAGVLGICLIWLLDLNVYHRLLVAVFREGRKLERQFPWLPRFRTNMYAVGRIEGQRKDPVWRRLGYYYAGTTSVPLIAGLYHFARFLLDSGYSRETTSLLTLGILMISVAGILALLLCFSKPDPGDDEA